MVTEVAACSRRCITIPLFNLCSLVFSTVWMDNSVYSGHGDGYYLFKPDGDMALLHVLAPVSPSSSSPP